MHGGRPVKMILHVYCNGHRNNPNPWCNVAFFLEGTELLCSKMWYETLKEKCPTTISHVKLYLVLYMDLAYRRCLTNLPWS